MSKVLNIYGIMVDENTIDGQLIKKWRTTKPYFWNSDYLEEWIREKLKNYSEPFLVLCHKTNEDNAKSIMYQGLKIFEQNGGLESTMARIFDSESVDIEGDINYYLNSIINSNQYGAYSIIAIIPKDYKKRQTIIQNNTLINNCIAFLVNPEGKVDQYGPASESEKGKKYI